MDLATLTNAPREVILGGLPYKVSALTLDEWGAVQAWLKDHGDDPVASALAQLARARAAGVEVAEEDRRSLLREARMEGRTWPPRVASAAWFDALAAAPGGEPQFTFAVLRKHQSSLTVEQAKDLCERLTREESTVLIYRALGMEVPLPKAGPPSPGGAGTIDLSSTTGASPSTGSTGASASSPTPTSAG